MDADGGMAKYDGNKAGAKLGTGYCDAQCPHDLKFINGEPNVDGWKPSATDPNAGVGKYGTCCAEMDIWESNSISTAYTAHACSVTEQTRCEGVQCGDNGGDRFKGVCDKNGCDIQPYRLGNTTFFGPGASFMLDTTKPMTVTTQFITDDGTDGGKLVEIRRSYVQDGKTVETPAVQVGAKRYDSISHDFCAAEKELFKDGTNFLDKGGMGSIDDMNEGGMVLVMSLWDDHYADMLWLDSTYPTDTPTAPGAKRGTCSTDSGKPADVESQHADAYVKYSNIRYGELGSTAGGTPSPSPASPSPSPPVPAGCPRARSGLHRPVPVDAGRRVPGVRPAASALLADDEALAAGRRRARAVGGVLGVLRQRLRVRRAQWRCLALRADADASRRSHTQPTRRTPTPSSPRAPRASPPPGSRRTAPPPRGAGAPPPRERGEGRGTLSRERRKCRNPRFGSS